MKAPGPPANPPPSISEAVDAIRMAQSELERAVVKGDLSGDPLRFALGGLSAALGAFLVGIEAIRQPMDPVFAANLAHGAAQAAGAGARREVTRLAVAMNRRLAVAVGGTVALLVSLSVAIGYGWGHREGVERTAIVFQALSPRLSDGSASAASWLNLIRENDIRDALHQCEGRSVWVNASGRRACAVPLWLDPPIAVSQPTPRS